MRGLFESIPAMMFLASAALAQDPAATFPNKPIKIIVCVPAGGGVDTVTRIVAEGLPPEARTARHRREPRGCRRQHRRRGRFHV